MPVLRSRGNAWNMNNNGNLNNNNLNNTNRVLSCANLTDVYRCVYGMVTLEELHEVYMVARSNKRRSRDAVLFEMDMERNLVQLCEDLNGRKLDTSTNYAFVVHSPKDREIFATTMYVRIVHHFLERKLRPEYERILSSRSFNNRRGKGLHAAILQFRRDVFDVTEGFTRDAWISHLDLKGYFPNADVETALGQQLDIIDGAYSGEEAEDLRYMMESCMRADPARHCNIYVPRSEWAGIAPEKSLFNKPTGTGGAIGFLIWQNAMGRYINDVILWLESFPFIRVVVFVDDIYVVTSDRERFLDIIPELRERMSRLKVRLNENKFYFQHYSKGVRILGSRVRFDREFLDDSTVRRAFHKVDEWRLVKGLQWKADRLLSTMNTYVGMMKTKNMRETTGKFVERVLDAFGRYLEWNPQKACFRLKGKYKLKSVLERKYRVRL